MDELEARFNAMTWSYADQDEGAFQELCRRVADVGRVEDLRTYSEIVAGLVFRLDNVEQGEPFEIDTHAWSDRDRAILGSFLGRLCAETYRRGRFMGSALVVGSQTRQPTGGFWDLMREVQAFEGRNQNERDEFWLRHVQRAYRWYQTNEW